MSPSASKSGHATRPPAGAGDGPDGDPAEFERLRTLSLSFRHAYRTLRRLRGRETHLLCGEISHAQFELLIELRDRGPLAAGELAQVAGLSGASVSQMVDRLAEEGHVERVRSDDDRRVVKVKLSKRGRRSIKPTVEQWRERWEEAFEGVADEDLQVASEVIDRIASVFQDHEKT